MSKKVKSTTSKKPKLPKLEVSRPIEIEPVHSGLRITDKFDHPHWNLWKHVLSNGVELSTIREHFPFVIDNIAVNFKDCDDGTGDVNLTVHYDLELLEQPVAMKMSGDNFMSLVDIYLSSLIKNILVDQAKLMSEQEEQSRKEKDSIGDKS